MDNKEYINKWNESTSLSSLMNVNKETSAFGLSLTEEDASQLLIERKESLKEKRRIEFGEGILTSLIKTFCDSPYIYQDNYVETIARLQDIFYEYKNDTADRLTDEELLILMKKAFNGKCEGSLDYLEETILDDYARSIRTEGEKFLIRSRRQRDIEDDKL